MNAQLSLFPVRGFAVALPGGYLAHDHLRNLPAFYRTRRAARRDSAIATWHHGRIVNVEIHEGVEGRPTYVVLP
jgi:hypothetical protein